MDFKDLKAYPEWRELLSKIEPLLKTKTNFSYDELKELCGLDVRSDRGRSQFYKFRKQALAQWQIWFECSPRFGYIKIPAADHPKSAVKRVRWANRKVKIAKAINALTRYEELSPAQLVLQAQTAALLEDLSHTFNSTSRRLAATAAKLKMDISDEDLKVLTEEPVKKVKRLPPPLPRPKI